MHQLVCVVTLCGCTRQETIVLCLLVAVQERLALATSRLPQCSIVAARLAGKISDVIILNMEVGLWRVLQKPILHLCINWCC
jgi:hypothetical protein